MAALLLLVGCASGGRADGEDSTDDTGDDVPATPDAPRPDAAPPIPPVDAPGTPDAFVPAPDACVPMATEQLLNPGFDTGPGGGWVEDPIIYDGMPFPIVQTLPASAPFTAHSGNYVAWLGGLSSVEDFLEFRNLVDEIEQTITIPAGASDLVIAGQYLVQTAEASDAGANDTFAIELLAANGTRVDTILTANNTTAATVGAWTAFSKPISASLAGQSLRLRATSTNDPTEATSFFLDSLTFTATRSCP